MAHKGVIPSPEAWEILKDVARDVRRNRATRKARRMPRRRTSGGGGGTCACEEVHEFFTTGTLTGGTWSISYNIGGSTESISSIDDATTAAQLQTAIEGHSEVASGDIVCFGGPFPDVAIYCKFIGDLSSTNIPLPAPNSGSLTGTAPRVKVRKASAYDWS